MSREETSFTSYEQAVDWINGLIPLGIKPGLDRMRRIMERLGNPERRLKFIHVAGTNGKGSTCAYLSSVLMRAGFDTGSFTSPYITRFTDRIQINGQDIPDEQVLTIVNRLKPIADELADSTLGSPTMFEMTTALAIVYFATVAYPDFVVWETGLGGRLDSTNVVVPIISVITSIGLEHTDLLGDTLEQIAAEKAGIVKAGVPVVSTATQPIVREVLGKTAKEKRSTLYLLDREFSFTVGERKLGSQTFDFHGPFRDVKYATISMNGRHQMHNASAALMTLEVLRQYYAVVIDDDDLLEGLESANWPGRLEMVGEGPSILLDGAHNPQCAEALAQAIQDTYSHRRVHFMFGMLANKNHTDYVRHILPIVDTLIVTEPDFRKRMEANKLAELIEQMKVDFAKPELSIIVEPDWQKALEVLTSITEQGDLAVVSGTLYLISDVRGRVLQQTITEKGW